MRVAMFHNDLPEPDRKPGGVSVYVHRLSQALSARGHEVVVFTHSPAPPGASYETRKLPLPRVGDRRVIRQYVAPWLLNAEDLRGFDVAHFHGDDWFFLRRRLPVVRTFHGSALFEARSATSLVRRVDKRVVYRLELLARRLATASYGVGVDSVEVYRADGLLPPGVDVPEAAPPRAERPTILFVGTWSGRKRGATLHEIFQRVVRPAVPGAELWMVSDECEPAEGVRWIQAPSDEELSELYSRAWVFCMPSSYEGFGIPYLEAMAHGTPLLTTPNPGVETILGEGHRAIVGSTDDLGGRLVELLGDERLREDLAREGRERAAAFSWTRSAERHEEAYRGAVERFSSRSRTNPVT
jgi:phosphatidylinositol alpha-mannosyltransferase